MKTEWIAGVSCAGLIAAGIGALWMGAGKFLSLLDLFPETVPTVAGTVSEPTVASTPRWNVGDRDFRPTEPPEPTNTPETDRNTPPQPPFPKSADAGSPAAPRTAAELDRAFERFLADRGLPVPYLRGHALAASSETPTLDEKSAETAGSRFTEATRTLQEDYEILDARPRPGGEVWIQVDPREVARLSMEELMERAAALYGDAGAPLKVVVWAGNRPHTVRTFHGAPIF
jgi:hypothetical protein